MPIGLKFQQRIKKMIIYKALLKYGYSNFKLEILEYTSQETVLAREQYYIDLFKPEYNILSNANSSYGYKHSEESLFKIRAHLKKLNNQKSIKVEIKDINTNDISIFESIRKAALTLNVDKKTVIRYDKNKTVFKNRYLINIRRTP